MPQSGVRYVVTLQDLTAPAFNTMNANANKVEATIAGLQRSLNGMASTIGVGLGIYAIKDAVKEYAQYEQSLIRIKNVSESVTEGMKNQNFILAEAKKFKIDIAEATDSFGEFLTMIRGAHIASSDVRKLHDELLLIGKVTALPQSQMDASVRNLGKLLEEGALEGRHLRPLMYQLSGLAPYVASQLNLTTQQFEKYLSSGKLTKSALDSKMLLNAVSQYAKDLTPKLNESLNSTQSSLNELHNAFFEMKNDLVVALKPSIMGFIDMMKTSAHWISENSDMVASLIKGVVGLSIAYKGVNTASGLVGLMRGAQGVGAIGAGASATGAGLGLSVVGGALLVALTAGSIVALVNSLKPESTASGASDVDFSSGSSVFKDKLYNFITKGQWTVSQTKQEADYFESIATLRNQIESSLKTLGNFQSWNIGNSQVLGMKAYSVLPDIIRNQINQEVGNYVARGEKKPAVNYANIGGFLEALQADNDILKNISEGKQQGFEMLQLWKNVRKQDDNPFAKGKGLLGFEKDEVKGNRPQTYNVYIKEMNGNKDCKFELQSLDKMDASAFGRRMADILLSVTNDTQLRNGN